MGKPHAQAVGFDNARGPVSTSKSAAILDELKSKSGDIDVLQKHLALEQVINADSPLVLGNKLVLLQDGPATYQAMFAAIRKAKDHINLETYIFEDDDSGGGVPETVHRHLDQAKGRAVGSEKLLPQTQ
jgi:cardiolipin synthase